MKNKPKSQRRAPLTPQRELARRAVPQRLARVAPKTSANPKYVRTLADKRVALKQWWEEQKLPGKIQAWVEAPADSLADDHDFVAEGMGRSWTLVPVSEYRTPPALASDLLAYFQREHMHSLRLGLSQVWLRASYPGKWAILLHARVRTPTCGHALKLLANHLRAHHPEVESLHVVSTRANRPIDLAAPPRTAHLESRAYYGPETLCTGPDGHLAHILDVLPAHRSAWTQLPERLKAALHFKPADRVLDLFSAGGHIGLSLASVCAQVWIVDTRALARESVQANMHRLGNPRNVHFVSAAIDGAWLQKFFDTNTIGEPWSLVVDPNPGEALPPGLVPTACALKPGRIVHLFSDFALLPAELRKWRRHGYMVRKILPFDTAPGEVGFTLAVLLVPDTQGVMAMKPKKAVGATAPQPSAVATTGSKTIPRFIQKTRKIAK